MSYTVVLSPEARTNLIELDAYLATAASPDIAARYVDAILNLCHSLQTFPERGTRRDDIRPGLRVTHYRGRAVIAYTVDQQNVVILGVFYGGRDYASLLRDV